MLITSAQTLATSLMFWAIISVAFSAVRDIPGGSAVDLSVHCIC